MNGEVGEAASPLHHLDDAAAHEVAWREPVDTLAPEVDLAPGDVAPFDAEQVGDRLERGGLAGAVGSQQGNDRPIGNRDGDTAQDRNHMVVDDLDRVEPQ